MIFSLGTELEHPLKTSNEVKLQSEWHMVIAPSSIRDFAQQACEPKQNYTVVLFCLVVVVVLH